MPTESAAKAGLTQHAEVRLLSKVDEQFWGCSAFHCPFCDVQEQRDQPLAVQGNGASALHRGKLLLNLTDDLVICTDAPATFTAEEAAFLHNKKVRIIETPLTATTSAGTQMDSLNFADGSSIPVG